MQTVSFFKLKFF